MQGPVRLLIVEDHADDAEILLHHLQREGIAVDAVVVRDRVGLEEALERARWDLVVTDYRLPDLTGPEVLRLLAASGRDLPCILVSGEVGEEKAAEVMRLGARDCVLKSNLARLAPAIRREMQEAEHRRAHLAALDRLRESEERYALAMLGANDGLFDWDLENHRVYYSPRWKQMLGLDDEEVTTSPDEWMKRVHPEDLGHLQRRLRAHLAGLDTQLEVEHRVQDRFGTFRWMLSRGRTTRDATGKALRLAGSQTDITARKLAEERLAHAAAHDALTGLPNRALFLDRLRHAICRYQRSPGHRFAVLFVDIDRFRLVIDSLGHMAGDELLMKIAQRVSGCLRPGDTVARFGGNVFTLLLENVDDFSTAIAVANRIQTELMRPVKLQAVDVYTLSSIGLKLAGSSPQTAEEILKDADTALSQAKTRGGGQYAIFDAHMSVEASRRLQLETDLRRALERREFRPNYQPIVELPSGRIVGAEVLVRWQHPTRGLLAPDAFLPVAEETGLVLDLDWQTLDLAFAQLAAWLGELGQRPLILSVNLSARHFNRPGLADRLLAACRQHGVDPDRIKVEITETAILQINDTTTAELLSLREMGFHLCLDDFGTGYSPLGNLYRLPIDSLKIDRSFVSHMTGDKHKTEIVRSIVNLAASLEKTVIAEGVETDDQRQSLAEMACPLAQGWLFSRAVDPATMGGLLRRA